MEPTDATVHTNFHVHHQNRVHESVFNHVERSVTVLIHSYILIFQKSCFIKTRGYALVFADVRPKRIVQLENESLNIQFEVSKRVTQRLVTRIMKIFLEEVLGYPVAIVEKEDEFNATATIARLSEYPRRVK